MRYNPTATLPRSATQSGVNPAEFDRLRLSLATAEDILNWSYGEVLKAETINYRTQKPEKDGLFCEKIFGPEKDINPHDVRFKGVRSREAAVDKQGALVTKAIVRRERMGHVKLAAPVVHTWFLRTIPSPLAQVTGLKVKDLDRIICFVDWLVLEIDQSAIKAHAKVLAGEAKTLEAEIKAQTRERLTKSADPAARQSLANLKADLRAKQAEYQLVESVSVQTKHSRLAESDYRQLPKAVRKYLRVGMGGEAIYQMLKDINLATLIKRIEADIAATKSDHQKRALLHRLRALEGIHQAGVKIESMCLTVLPVLPPDLRPIVQLTGGKFASTDLNDLYRRVIIRNNRLKNLMELDAPDIICLNEKRMLQGAVDALIDNSSSRSTPPVTSTNQNRKLKSLTDLLRGKHGRLRQNNLGKRVDYSGRSVIVSGPRLRLVECGLPKIMALELFKNFVIGWIMANDPTMNFPAASRLVEEARDNIVWDALDDVIKGKYVLLNRAPTLHRLSIQAFRPKLIEGKSIQLPPLVCKGFNADFDGDHMAVHLPLSDEAQREARELMTPASNLLHPATGRPILHLDQDIVIGLYYLTYDKYPGAPQRTFPDVGMAVTACDHGQIEYQTPIKVRVGGQLLETNLGRVLFNEILPPDFPFQNMTLNQKAIFQVMNLVYDSYDWEQTVDIADALKDLAFESATQSGLSLGIGDFMKFDGVAAVQAEGAARVDAINRHMAAGHITEAERYRLIIQSWSEADRRVRELVTDQFGHEATSLKVVVDSEARGKININQIKQMMAMIGLQSDTLGQALELPITSSYFQGLKTLEYFVAARGGRKSLVDVALSTADSGYLTRRLVYVAQDVFTVPGEPTADYGFDLTRADSETIGVSLGRRLTGRYSAGPVELEGQTVLDRGDLITSELAEQIEASDLSSIKILSVLTDINLEGVSTKSYGLDPANGRLVASNHPIGVIAAQSIGEPSTQLKLDSRHSGGVASVTRHLVSTGLDRIIELFEARTPKGVGFLAEIDGEVTVQAQPDGSHQITVQPPADMQFNCLLPDRLVGPDSAVVAVGEAVDGDQTVLVGNDQSVVLAPVPGKVTAVTHSDSGDLVLSIKPVELAVETHRVPPLQEVLVKTGQSVTRGAVLTAGSLALDRLLAIRGLADTQRYILTQVSQVFMSQDNSYIADKHLEVVVRQMFSRIQIIDAGDSKFVDGDFVSKPVLDQANRRLLEAGKQPATWSQLVLGIAKISGLSDSFLAAAAFQNTTQVLVRSAIWGRVDKLRGLTENVILGRKIPIGTGVAPPVVEEVIASSEVLPAVEADSEANGAPSLVTTETEPAPAESPAAQT